jgi:hypothetical protein
LRIANHNKRAVFLTSDEVGIDIHTASAGRFGPDLPSLYNEWEPFTAWAQGLSGLAADVAIDRSLLGSPSPAPAAGVRDRVELLRSREGVRVRPARDQLPPVFTKFQTCITGPDTTGCPARGGQRGLGSRAGRRDRQGSQERFGSRCLGLCCRADDRAGHLRTCFPAPGPGTPVRAGQVLPRLRPGRAVASARDEFANPDDLEIGCSLDGEEVQKGRTSELIFSVPALIQGLSATATLLPGDIIFTGTPAAWAWAGARSVSSSPAKPWFPASKASAT